MNTVKLII